MFDRVLSKFLLFVIDLHPYYALSGVALILTILAAGYLKFRVRVPENYVLHYDSNRVPKGPGFHFMPYAHTTIDVKPRTLTIGLDELQTTGRTDTYREGGTGPRHESTVHRAPRHSSKDGVIISWRPDERRLTDYLQSQRTFREQILAYLAVRPDASGLQAFIDDHRLGVKIITIYDARAEKRKGDSVNVGDAEIPYEG
jgi:hypothetical protein